MLRDTILDESSRWTFFGFKKYFWGSIRVHVKSRSNNTAERGTLRDRNRKSTILYEYRSFLFRNWSFLFENRSFWFEKRSFWFEFFGSFLQLPCDLKIKDENCVDFLFSKLPKVRSKAFRCEEVIIFIRYIFYITPKNIFIIQIETK